MTDESSLYTIPVTRLMEETEKRNYRINRESFPHYCPPGAGHWGMVKMAFQVPDVAVVFVIPMGCGRHGGIANMMDGLQGILAYLPIAEVDIVTGEHLQKTEDALAELIEEDSPKGILLFTTCIDELLGSDFDSVMERTEQQYGIPVRRAKMNPLMMLSRKSPDLMIYVSMHDFLIPAEKEETLYNLIGTPCPVDSESELYCLIENAGFQPLQHIAGFRDFESHYSMGRARGNLLIGIAGIRAVEHLEKKLGQSWIAVYGLFRPEGIAENYQAMESYLGCALDWQPYEEELHVFLEQVRPALKGKTCVIGTTLQAAPFELARFLTEMGMEVRYITAGLVRPYERKHMSWLEEKSPQIKVIPSVDPSLSMTGGIVDTVDFGFGLDTPAYFKIGSLVDISVDDNLYGFSGTRKLIEKILTAESFTKTIKEHVYSLSLVV